MTGPAGLVRLGDAQAGDLVRTGVSRKRRRVRHFSSVEHIARVEHQYGPGGSVLWVIPLCGVGGGRSESASSTRLCSDCERSARKRGIGDLG